MQANEKLNVKSIEIDPTILGNPENLLKPLWISNYGRNVSERAFVLLYFTKSQVKIEYLLLLLHIFPNHPS